MLYQDIACAWDMNTQISSCKTIDEILSMSAAVMDNTGYLIVIREGDCIGVLTLQALLKAVVRGNNKTPVGDMALAAPKRVEAKAALDLHDFDEADVCIVYDNDKPCGHISKQKAQEGFNSYLLSALAETADKIAHLGGRNYKHNRIFRETSFHTTHLLKQLLTAIQENTQAFWKILKYSSDSIYVTDRNGVGIFGNIAFENSISATEMEYVERNVEDLTKKGFFHPPVSPMVIKEKKSVTIKQRGSLGTRWWIVTGVPIFDEAGELDMVVTNAKNLEECKQLLTYTEQNKKKIFDLERKDLSKSLVYSTPHMKKVMGLADKAAEINSTVLITGESGVGKSLVARHIHKQSDRSSKELLEINCSSIPESLFESEFFGYEAGAFTNAKESGKPGFIEMADKGTLLLDEIGDIPLRLQGKLLHVLQDKKVIRVGGMRAIDVDVHIIAATNQPLEKLIEEGKFRADLYYRLNVFPIHILPLRQRMEETPLLVRYYLQYYNDKYRKRVLLSDNAIGKIRELPWYGNVRQLEAFVERLVILYSDTVAFTDLAKELSQISNPPSITAADKSSQVVCVNHIVSLQKAVEETERQLFIMATEEGKSSYEVAKRLGISQTHAYRKMRKYLD